MVLKVQGLSFGYNSRPVLKDVHLGAECGEVTSLIGPNAAGKTTLLRCIVGILKVGAGKIWLEGKEIGDLNRAEIAKRMAYVPQDEHPCFPSTVFDSVLIGRRQYLGWKPAERDIDMVCDVLDILGLAGNALRDSMELSGGEKQKMHIARALVQESKILLLDEPTSNLDLRHQLEVMETVRRLARERGFAVLMAIHDVNLAARFSDGVIMLKDGRIFAAGCSQDVLTAENMKSVYGVDAAVIDVDGVPYVVAHRALDEVEHI